MVAFPPADGFSQVTNTYKINPLTQGIVAYERISEFSKDGYDYATHEYQKSPGGNTHVRQDVSYPDGNGGVETIEGPLYVIPSAELWGALNAIGETAGDLLAGHLSNDNIYQDVLYSAALKTIGVHFGTAAAFAIAGSEAAAVFQALTGADLNSPGGTTYITPEIEKTFLTNLHSSVSGALASVIVAEFGEALGGRWGVGGGCLHCGYCFDIPINE